MRRSSLMRTPGSSSIPTALFIGGGPAVHSGLTGRKNAIDTYGEYSRLSGAALSGKDPSRIDRTGAYAARYAAKNVDRSRTCNLLRGAAQLFHRIFPAGEHPGGDLRDRQTYLIKRSPISSRNISTFDRRGSCASSTFDSSPLRSRAVFIANLRRTVM